MRHGVEQSGAQLFALARRLGLSQLLDGARVRHRDGDQRAQWPQAFAAKEPVPEIPRLPMARTPEPNRNEAQAVGRIDHGFLARHHWP